MSRRRSKLVAMVLCVVAVLICVLESDAPRARYDTLYAASLQKPTYSALNRLILSRIDTCYIRCFGFHVSSFEMLLNYFAPVFQEHTLRRKYSTTRRLRVPVKSHRNVNAAICLGLVLCYYRSQSEHHVLCLVSGLVPSCCSWYLTFGHLILNVSTEVLLSSYFVLL